jgi:aminoglycoside phosphotransferase (APT) family kinase protein
MSESPDAAVDTTALAAWLQEHEPALLVAADESLRVSRFAGGYSNLTYLVERGAQRLVLRRPPPGVSGGPAHDVLREYRLLRALWPITRQVPEPLAVCEDATVLGAPFYLMQHVPGVILRDRAPEGVALDSRTMRALCNAFVDAMVALHAVDVQHTGLHAFGRGAGYVARQVSGWTARWQASRTVSVPDMEALASWLEQHQPVESPTAALIHNDFKFDNLVLDPDDVTRVRAVLDWEMATIGDPLMDLGTTLAYWIEPGDPALFRALGLGITAMPGAFTRAELIASYAERTERDVSAMSFYLAFGRFKLAVVAQQLHARYVRGLSGDGRFAALDVVVRTLAEQGRAGVV